MVVKNTLKWSEKHTQIAKKLEERLKSRDVQITYSSFNEYMRDLHGKAV